MNFEEFLASLRSDVERFEANWRDRQKTNPDVYPDEMGEGDWFEQFLIFMTGQEL